MIEAQDFQALILNAIDSDVGQVREDQFAGSLNPPLSPTTREISQAITTIKESLCDLGCSFGVVLLNAANDIVKVLSGGCGPAHAHYGRSIF